MKRSEKLITPQQVYSTVDAECGDCRFCFNAKPDGPLGRDDFYCARFHPHPEPKARINAYDQACGKFERRSDVR